MDYMQEIGRTAKEASSKVQFLKQTQKNEDAELYEESDVLRCF